MTSTSRSRANAREFNGEYAKLTNNQPLRAIGLVAILDEEGLCTRRLKPDTQTADFTVPDKYIMRFGLQFIDKFLF